MGAASSPHRWAGWPAGLAAWLRRPWLQAVLAGALGLLLGAAFSVGPAELAISLVFIGVCLLLTLRRPLDGLLLILILQPFVNYFYLNLQMGRGIPDITLGRLGVVILFALVLARGATGQHPLQRLTRVDAFLVLGGLALLFAALRGRSLTVFLQWVFDMYLTPFMLYYVVKHLVTDRAAVRRVLWAVALIGAYNGLYGIYTQVTGNILFLERATAQGPFWYTESLRIMRGLLDSPHVFGLVFSLAIPIDFYLLLKAERPSQRILAAVFLALALGGVFFTYKRTAWIATLASLAVIPIFFPRFRRLLVVLLATAAVAGWLYTDQIERSAVVNERLNEKTSTFNGRLDLWITALEYAAESPWFGHGMGNFQARSGLRSIESNYLWLLVDAGLAGLAPFLLVLFFLFQTGLRLYRARSSLLFVDRDEVAIFWSILAAYVVSLSTVVMNHEFPHQVFFVAAGAMIGSQEAILRRLGPEPIPAGVTAPAPVQS